jgi:opacity protein-like surface antigen
MRPADWHGLDHITLTQLASGQTATPFLWRFGWAAGAGVEVPVAPHWTARLEYLFTDYGISSVTFSGMASGLIPISRCKSCRRA